MAVLNRLRHRTGLVRVDSTGLVIGIRISGADLVLPGPSGDPLHTLVAGQTGSGKSMLQRAIVGAGAARPDVAFVALDPKRTALGMWAPRCTMVAKTISECTSALVTVWKEVKRRLAVMDETGVDEWSPELGGPFIMVVIDELTEVVAPDPELFVDLMVDMERFVAGTKAFEAHGKALKASIAIAKTNQGGQGMFLASLARICRSSGVQIVAATQYPESAVLDTQFRSNMTVRVMMRVGSSEMVTVILGAGQEADVTADSISIKEQGGCWVGGIEGRPVRGRGFLIEPDEARARAAATEHLRWTQSQVFVDQEFGGREAGAPDDRREAGAKADPAPESLTRPVIVLNGGARS